MTATLSENDTDTRELASGRVVRVIGPVVDVEFPKGSIPPIYQALTVPLQREGETFSLVLEVSLHVGDNVVRAIAMKPTDGLARGVQVTTPAPPSACRSAR